MGKVTVEYAISRLDIREDMVIVYLRNLKMSQLEIPSPEGTVVIGPDPKADPGKAFMDMAQKMMSQAGNLFSHPPMAHFMPPDEMNLQFTREQYETLGKPMVGELMRAEVSIVVQEG